MRLSSENTSMKNKLHVNKDASELREHINEDKPHENKDANELQGDINGSKLHEDFDAENADVKNALSDDVETGVGKSCL